jgi:hypothetical protein
MNRRHPPDHLGDPPQAVDINILAEATSETHLPQSGCDHDQQHRNHRRTPLDADRPGNAMRQSWMDDPNIVWVGLHLAALPITYLVYPFAMDATASAWPFPDGTSLVPLLLVGLVCYPVSTFIGGYEPID